MPATKVGIVYSVALRTRRLLRVPDDDSELTALQKNLRPGEGYIEQGLDDYLKNGPDKAIEDAIGVALSDRCIVADPGKFVVAAVNADPAIDGISGYSLHLSEEGDVNDRVHADGVTIERRYIKVDELSTVVEVVWQDVKLPAPAPPVGGETISSATLIVGDKTKEPSQLPEEAVFG